MSYALVAPVVAVGDPTKASDHNKDLTDMASHDHDVTNTVAVKVIQSGNDAAKAASPVLGESYIAGDISSAYVCLTAASWTGVITANGLMPLSASWSIASQAITNIGSLRFNGVEATTGSIRFAYDDTIVYRDNGNSGNYQALGFTTAELVELGPSSGIVVDSSGNMGTGGVAPNSSFEIDVSDQFRCQDGMVIPGGTDKWAT